MIWPIAFKSIRVRLWIALALLAVATIGVGSVAWYTLDRANDDLDALHRQSLSEVARAINLSKRSSDLATSAPYLLNLGSSYLLNLEGKRLIAAIDDVGSRWLNSLTENPSNENSINGYEIDVSEQLSDMRQAINDLVIASGSLSLAQDEVATANRQLFALRNQFLSVMQSEDANVTDRLNWLPLLSMSDFALGAGFGSNLIGVGEQQRLYNGQKRAINDIELSLEQLANFKKIEEVMFGPSGLFELRRKELAFNLNANNALFRIRYSAEQINNFAGEFSTRAETFLAIQRNNTVSSIRFAKTAILAIGAASFALALLSAFYVSNYVIRNIGIVSTAMTKLAAGDRSTVLSRTNSKKDEIGDLFRSFRTFRANALRLDRSNTQLNNRNALFEKVFNNITDGVAIADNTGHLTALSPNLIKMLRINTELANNRTILDILSNTQFAKATTDAGLTQQFRGFVELHGDEAKTLEVRVSRLPDEGRVWLFSDATERRRVNERLSQIRRIESLGKVTGEVAHDFGNILATISSNLYLLENSKTADASTQRQRISNAVEIGTSLTQRLLAFARKQHLEPETTELNGLVDGLVGLIDIGLKDGVQLETELADQEIFVKVDPGQLESAILNLCLNSNQAIDGKGTICISVNVLPDDVAAIEVRDTGIGMDDATIIQAAEPFFSTRLDGEGTGLGLSMVYGFIKQTGGEIQIDSSIEKGTSIRLTLPIEKNLDGRHQNLGHLKNILLVEDEPAAMALAANNLRALGLMVVEAPSFKAAQRALNKFETLDVLVTDIQLDNGYSGWDLAERVLEKNENTLVVITSGRLPRHHPLSTKFQERLKCISKPTTTENLSMALNLTHRPKQNS